MGACGRPRCLKPPEVGGGEEPLSTCWDHADPVPALSLVAVAPLSVLRAWVFLLLLKRSVYVPLRPVLFVVSGPEG